MPVASKLATFAASRPFRGLVLMAAAATTFTLGACVGNQQHADALLNPSPVEATETRRYEDNWNQAAYSADTNLRLLNSDMARFWMLDRPSRLTPVPTR